MEASTVPAGPPASQRIQSFISTYGLIGVLLALPVYFAIDDLSEAGNLTRLGENVAAGISNGAIWAVGSSRVDLQACKLEYSIVSPK